MSDQLIKPFSSNIKESYLVEVPGSKSITNRALLLAALAKGKSTLSGVLFSDDSRHFLSCLISLGFQVEINEEKKTVTVYGEGGHIPKEIASIDVGSAGTAARFLSAFLGISKGNFFIDASEQMKKRPMKELFDSLSLLGASFTYEGNEGFLPVQITNAAPLQSAEITVNIDKSSQFLSALLISSCLFEQDVTIHITGTHGMAYIDMTIAMMKQFGVSVARPSENTFFIKGGQTYQALDYQIEPDVSAACYFYSLAPLLGTAVTVKHIPEQSLQGDIRFLDVLEQMGCKTEVTPIGRKVVGCSPSAFTGCSIDMSAFSDQALTLAAIAPFANSKTTITGIGHIRYQECNRLAAICNELTRVGITCHELPDGVEILPGTPHSAEIETYQDHRVAMAFSLIGTKTNGILIKNAECCAKTFENYFEVLNSLYE